MYGPAAAVNTSGAIIRTRIVVRQRIILCYFAI